MDLHAALTMTHELEVPMKSMVLCAGLALCLFVSGCARDPSLEGDGAGLIIDGGGSSGDNSSPAGGDARSVADGGGSRGDHGGAVNGDGSPVGDQGAFLGDVSPGLVCDPSFGQTQACGGNLVGKWQYQSGCIADAAFDDLRASCSGVQISAVSCALAPGNAVTFFANGTFARQFSGSIFAKALFGQSCTKLGCAALQVALKLSLAKFPGSTISCAPMSGGCDCSVELKLASYSLGTFKTNGGVVTVTALGVDYPFYYCVRGNQVLYRGTEQNSVDQNVVYLLESAP
jgi:hypothetical protein